MLRNWEWVIGGELEKIYLPLSILWWQKGEDLNKKVLDDLIQMGNKHGKGGGGENGGIEKSSKKVTKRKTENLIFNFIH